jgi:hypothetical protein
MQQKPLHARPNRVITNKIKNHNDPTIFRNPECMTCSFGTSVVESHGTVPVEDTEELEMTSV